MEKFKNRFALSALSLLLVLSLLMGGTMAWFTDTEHVGANFQSGVLDVKLTEGNTGETVPLNFANLRPLTIDQLRAEFKMDETGLIGNQNTDGYDGTPRYFYQINVENKGSLPMNAVLAIREQAKGSDPELPYGHKIPNIVENGSGGVVVDEDEPEIACQNELREWLHIQLYRVEEAGGGYQLQPIPTGAADDPDGTVALWRDAAPSDYRLPEVIGANETETFIVAAWLPEAKDNNMSQAKHFHASLYVNAGQADDGATMAELPEWSSSSTPSAAEAKVNVRYMWKLNDGSQVALKELARTIAANPGETVLAPSAEELPGYHAAEGSEGYSVTVKEDGTVSYQGNDTAAVFVVEQDAYTDDETQLFDSGDGTKENPFVIMNARQLDNLNQYCGVEGYMEESCFALGADIDLSGYYNPDWPEWNESHGWMPVGRRSTYTYDFFPGVLDGKGHTVAGLRIDCGDQAAFAGLFGECNGTIKNLNVLDAEITSAATRNDFMTGILMGKLTNGTVESCYVSGNVTAKNGEVAGLVGEAGYATTIKNCTVKADITAESGSAVLLTVMPYEAVTITNCTGTGTINGQPATYDSNAGA